MDETGGIPATGRTRCGAKRDLKDRVLTSMARQAKTCIWGSSKPPYATTINGYSVKVDSKQSM
jgi:hypothetical protein